MTQIAFLAHLQLIAAHVTFWVALGFCILTSTFWPWWKTDLGWTIVLKTMCIALVLLPFELKSLFDVNPLDLWFRWLSTVSFTAIPIVIMWRFVVIWIVQRYDPPPTKSSRITFARYREKLRLRNKRGNPADFEQLPKAEGSEHA